MDYLVVVDMQHDFVDGVLGSKYAQEIVPRVQKLFESFDGEVIFTRDTHGADYLQTQEGRLLPVEHCIKGSQGWELCYSGIDEKKIFDKNTFASVELCEYLKKRGALRITLVGVCTDICVVSNAMLLKALIPEAEIRVLADYCAGTTPEKHRCAINTMESCQII